MKTISVEELHARTEAIISDAAFDTIVVTKDGQPRAILKPYQDEASIKRQWEERERILSELPVLSEDSSRYISEDRDKR